MAGIAGFFGFGPKLTTPRLTLFLNQYGDARFVRGEEQYRIVHIKGKGGALVSRDSTMPMYRGRVLMPVRTDEQARYYQRRTNVMTIREDDPTPLVMAAGLQGRYRGSLIGQEDKKTLRSNVTEAAKADHAAEGSMADRLSQQLTLVLLVMVVIMGLIWLSIPVMKIFMR